MVVLGNKHIKELEGVVVSTKMDKTVVVLVKRVKIHPLYKKRFVVRKKYYAHNTIEGIQIDDVVRIREIKPLSKLKRRLCVEVVK